MLPFILTLSNRRLEGKVEGQRPSLGGHLPTPALTSDRSGSPPQCQKARAASVPSQVLRPDPPLPSVRLGARALLVAQAVPGTG